MKVRLTRLGVISLLFLLPLGLIGCADDQQGVQEAVNAEEGLQGESEDSDYSYEDQAGGQEESEEYGQEGGDEYAEGGYENGDDYGGDDYGGDDYGGDEYADGGEGALDNAVDSSDITANDETVDQALADIVEDPNAGAADPAMMPEGGNYAADVSSPSINEVPQAVDGNIAVAAGGEVAATPAALPELGSKMPYVVKEGDTLGSIAGRIYGDRAKWREMSELSSLINPNLIYIGDVVYYQLTQETLNFAEIYEGLPRQEVVVQQGDTLSTIASRVLNSAMDWKHLWRQNDNVSDPDSLTAGTVLYYIAPGALTAALESNGSKEYQFVKNTDVEVEDVKIEVELETHDNNTIAGMISKVVFI